MKMSKAQYIVVAFLLYVVFLAAQMPAWVVPHFLSRYSQHSVVLEDMQGTVWQGRASHLVVQPPAKPVVTLKDVEWQILWLPLLQGEMGMRFTIADPLYPGKGTIVFGRKNRVVLKNFTVQLPASVLSVFAPQLAIWRPGGSLIAHGEHGVWMNGKMEGNAEIQWQNASTSLVKLPAVGSYRAVIHGTEPASQFRVVTLTGPLSVEGSGQWSRAQGLKFSGYAKATAYSSQLQDLLGLLGRNLGNGVYQISFP